VKPGLEGECLSEKQDFWWLLTVAESATGRVRTVFVRGRSASVVRAKGRELIEDHEVLGSVQLY
jgi:hypothetical protein